MTTNIARTVSNSRARTLKERLTEETGLSLHDAWWSKNGAIVKLPRNCSTSTDNARRIKRLTGLDVIILSDDVFEIVGVLSMPHRSEDPGFCPITGQPLSDGPEPTPLDVTLEASLLRDVLMVQGWQYRGGGPYPHSPTLNFERDGKTLTVKLSGKERK